MTPPTPVSDSYLETIEEADTFAAKRPNSTAWTGAGKAAALQEATSRIDSLPLRGQRYEPEYLENGVQKDSNLDGVAQVLEFPRYIDGVLCDWDHAAVSPSGRVGMAVVPAHVKLACLEEAIWILQHGDTQRLDNQQTGVVSQTIAGSQEIYIHGFGLQTLQSPQARVIMRRYVGVEVR
jgi:hypothetical protein